MVKRLTFFGLALLVGCSQNVSQLDIGLPSSSLSSHSRIETRFANSDFGISFSHDGYELYGSRKFGEKMIYNFKKFGDESIEPVGITFWAIPNPEKKDVQEWVLTEDKNFIADSKLTPMEVGGEKGLRYETKGLGDFDVVAISKNDLIFQFVGVIFDEKLDSNLDKILKTVQFFDAAE